MNRYGVDRTWRYWYVYEKQTWRKIGYNFKTRKEARLYAKKRNRIRRKSK